jgi:hypothetical protein
MRCLKHKHKHGALSVERKAHCDEGRVLKKVYSIKKIKTYSISLNICI